MYTVINDNSAYNRTLGFHTRNTNAMNQSVHKLASGMKINSAGDDPSGYAYSENIRGQMRSLNQANSNVQNDVSLLKTTSDAIANTIEIIQTLKARAIQSANDVYTDDEREVIQMEVTQYLNQVDINSKTKFNKQSLIDGSKATDGLNFHIGGEANFAVTLKLNNMDSTALGINSLDFSTRTGAVSALNTTDSNGNTVLGALDKALNTALKEQAKLGAFELRLGFTSDNITSAVENLNYADSAIRDTDVAQEMTKFVRYNILMQASQMMLAQQNQSATSVFNLLQPI